MTDDPAEHWRVYMRLQAELDASNQTSDRTWGLEEGLNAILDTAPVPDDPPEKTIANAERRERHRARLRRIHAPALEMGVPDNPARFDARIQLVEIRRVLPRRDWQLVCQVAVGTEYRAIARKTGETPGNLRLRIARIRRRLLKAAA